MANINLYDAYNKKRRKFGVNDSTRFQGSFVDAVNLTYGEINNLVFQADTLQPIGSFDDVIDNRLASFGTITFTAGVGQSNPAISDREFWSVEYDFERLSNTNTFIFGVPPGDRDTRAGKLSRARGDYCIALSSTAGNRDTKGDILAYLDGLALRMLNDGWREQHR